MPKNWKLIVLAVALVLVAIVVIQNTEEVTTRLLLAELKMPRAVLLFATFAIGFAAGIAATMRSRKAREAKPETT